MKLWLLQFRGELSKLTAQRLAWLGFAAAVAVECIFAACFKIPAVRALAVADFHRANVDVHLNFAGPTLAAHLLGETAMTASAFFIALIAGSVVAGDREDGTLRMALNRPVTRHRLWLQKLAVVIIYGVALTIFTAASSIAIGLACEGRGRLWMLMISENVLGDFDFSVGLWRYALASGLLTLSMLTIGLMAFAFSCFPIKPSTAVTFALTIFIGDSAARQIPAFAPFKSRFLMARIISWMHAFDDTIPVALLRQTYSQLLALDALLIVVAFLAFRRLELKP